ncbi:MAG: hypothetical protein J4428_00110 [Candidatus Aenigmarchaeota archaeon]|nr:hypothetical protein [Candidatus Aenigmarchaeota archaeon]
MLIFCDECNNIMLLEKNVHGMGKFVCRTCHASKKSKVKPIEIREEIKVIEPRIPLYA